MITREQFQLQVQRLEDTFGDRHFPDQRTHMIWDLVRALEYPAVIAIVDSFIKSAKHAPLPKDFADAAAEISRNNNHRTYALGEMQPREIANCHDCADSGFIRLARLSGAGEWARWETGSATCHCPRGRMAIEAGKRRAKGPIDLGAQFGEHWRKSYEVVKPY